MPQIGTDKRASKNRCTADDKPTSHYQSAQTSHNPVSGLLPGCQQTPRFPTVYLFRPAYIYPVQPRKEPNFSYRLVCAIYRAFQLLFPNEAIRGDDSARAMVDVAVQETERGCRVFENCDIRPMVKTIARKPEEGR